MTRNAFQKEKYKRELPYGKYVFPDGTQILFNRRYEPIVQHEVTDQESLHAKIPQAKRQWFYDDANSPWENEQTLQKCRYVLRSFGGDAQ